MFKHLIIFWFIIGFIYYIKKDKRHKNWDYETWLSYCILFWPYDIFLTIKNKRNKK